MEALLQLFRVVPQSDVTFPLRDNGGRGENWLPSDTCGKALMMGLGSGHVGGLFFCQEKWQLPSRCASEQWEACPTARRKYTV